MLGFMSELQGPHALSKLVEHQVEWGRCTNNKYNQKRTCIMFHVCVKDTIISGDRSFCLQFIFGLLYEAFHRRWSESSLRGEQRHAKLKKFCLAVATLTPNVKTTTRKASRLVGAPWLASFGQLPFHVFTKPSCQGIEFVLQVSSKV